MKEYNELDNEKYCIEMIPSNHPDIVQFRMYDTPTVRLVIERNGDIEYLFQLVEECEENDAIESMDYVCLNENDLFKHITDMFDKNLFDKE